MTAAQAMKFDHPRQLAPEDQVRADFYALLGSLFYQAPDDRLLQAIVIAPEPAEEGDAALAIAWRALAAASGVVTHEAVADEYAALFIGVGRAPVMLYGSYYIAGFMMEKPLAELRDDLAKLGFARGAGVNEPEDHLAALCDVMRAMILGGLSDRPASSVEQRAFFVKHMQPWVLRCCDATTKYEQANYYAKVAEFAKAFFEIEIAAFDMQ